MSDGSSRDGRGAGQPRGTHATGRDWAEQSLETLLLHDPHLDPSAGVIPPIHQTSLFTFGSFQEMLAAIEGRLDRHIYTRGGNPTLQAFEEKVAQLEGAEAACGFASGMAAIAAAILSNASAGDRIVCVRNVYPDAFKLMTRFLPRLGIATEFVDGRDSRRIAEALEGGSDRPAAKVLYLESPTTLMFELQDIALLSRAARKAGAVTIVDNSWATPLGQRPLEAGADLVLHSASKYLSGHSDVVAGVVAGSSGAISRIRETELMVLGGKLSPFDAWLLLRGMRTLPLRLERHGRSALGIARFLQGHPAVRAVHYPGLDDHPQAALFARDFRRASGLLSFELEHESMVEPFVDALRLFRLGVSWGGFESLVYPVLLSHLAGGPHSAARAFAVPRTLVRLHVGLEDATDLEVDLARALGAAVKGGQGMEV